jgi:hypothetical protein
LKTLFERADKDRQSFKFISSPEELETFPDYYIFLLTQTEYDSASDETKQAMLAKSHIILDDTQGYYTGRQELTQKSLQELGNLNHARDAIGKLLLLSILCMPF